MHVRSVFVAALFVGLLTAGTAAVAVPAAAESIDVETTLSETPTAGEVDAETQLRIPAGTASLEVTLPAGADVYETEGFTESGGERTYEWTGTTNEPYLRYDLAGNVTVDRGDGEEHTYAVTDEWAIVRSPTVDLRWSGLEAEVNRSTTVDGEGVAGPFITYLGPSESYTREAAGQQFHLVVPEAADLEADAAGILDALAYSAERLDFGERDPNVLVVAAPAADTGVEWAATGLQRGEADMWVRDAEALDDPRNTWIHEYTHTRQEYDSTEATRWSIEGMADYYAALLAYEQGYTDFETFQTRMSDGTAEELDDVRLVAPETWDGNRGNYKKGALVFGHLDRRLRAEADTTLDAVVGRLDGDDELTQQRFLEAVEAEGGADIRSDAERYTEATETPPVWSRADHVEAFGGADIRFEFERFAVSGPYRDKEVAEPRLVTGETLEATVRARNVGDEPGEFETAFRVGGDRAEGVSGQLAPGETTTLTVTHRFGEPGRFDLEEGTATARAVVDEPAPLEVTGLSVEPTAPARGETVRLRASVAAGADRPAAGDVTFTVDGEALTTERVQLVGSATVETTTAFEAPGQRTLAAGDRSTTVTVGAETVTPGEAPSGADGTSPESAGGSTPTAGSGAGAGPVLAGLAVAATLSLWRRADP
jgi:hypothetical protein